MMIAWRSICFCWVRDQWSLSGGLPFMAKWSKWSMCSVPRAQSPQIELPPAANGCTSISHQTSALMHSLQAVLSFHTTVYWLPLGGKGTDYNSNASIVNCSHSWIFPPMREMMMMMMTMMPLSDRLIFNPAGPDRLMACWEFYATAKNTQNYFDLSPTMLHQQLPKIPQVIDLKFRQRLHLLHWPLINV